MEHVCEMQMLRMSYTFKIREKHVVTQTLHFACAYMCVTTDQLYTVTRSVSIVQPSYDSIRTFM